ncbi:DUF4139 domain-containing protein [Rhodospirillum rubrum]|uniref:DUF4139 domain-containing protein n=1 Tax=Rhodospirillum rubrum (strain ATCC 11170 / ATH 1.1.1 / DSM 467 / LMG 4362 / NCIMB 8255 / S1) TaxID=269796 RepID=Q2RVE3_RHORT|nr:DUF4139 domain-containing protein [Rhodospirillum rubrum]ABC21902.1 hypothetical protein Rru_A1101 [Rhodospirillum rubrum ATCC 11170]AEO47604.1 hypothetical protein F11_05670 [Rhodospirillum rubrum F11]MBK5953465.1 hypothetical protein [Rhodospirillum rubrum]QXG81560.1 DUF4139 domain-containing protein [Rhodospirillum rubrum]HAP99551.1 hypothetical protein [Rhodospirillum rubrum]
MSFPRSRPAFAAVLLAATALASPALADGPLTLKRVLLSTGGVGLFEYEAKVDGSTALPLTVRLDQVDDVLKSLSVDDPSGRPASVRLAVREPLSEVFRDLPFAEDAFQSPAALFEALKGEPVTISGPQVMSGRIVSVTPEVTTRPDGSAQTRHRLGLMTNDGLRQVILEDAQGVAFSDSALTARIERALAAMAHLREKDSRTLDIAVDGTGSRAVRASFIAEVPLWKAGYRLTLPAEGANAKEKAKLAGWAVLENLSGQDWKDVSLTVVSGNPVTFRQDLFTPYRIDRPTVPVEVQGRVLPTPDSGAQPQADAAAGMMRSFAKSATPMAMAAAPAAPDEAMAESGQLASPGLGGGQAAALPLPSEGTAQVLFTLPQPVTLANGQTLMVPITESAIPLRRIAHYRPGESGRHPLAAVDLTNATGTALPPGAVSLTQATSGGLAYLGDARLGPVAKGDHRILAFAVDQDITVGEETGEDRTVSGLTASAGVLTLRQVARSQTTYTLTNNAGVERRLVIDHPRRPGWILTPPQGTDTVEEIGDAHRLSVTLEAGQTRALTIVLERPIEERLSAGALTAPLLAGLSATGKLSGPEKLTVERLATLSARASQIDDRLGAIHTESAQVVEDQGRLRENIKAVPADSDLHQRFMERLGQLEDRLGSLEQQGKEMEAEARKARADLDAYIAGLTLP